MDAVKSYGNMLVKDHVAANDKLKELAKCKGAASPTAISADKWSRLDKIVISKNFDKEFVKEVGLEDHRINISFFEKTNKDADDSEIKAFALKNLSTLKAGRGPAENLRSLSK